MCSAFLPFMIIHSDSRSLPYKEGCSELSVAFVYGGKEWESCPRISDF